MYVSFCADSFRSIRIMLFLLNCACHCTISKSRVSTRQMPEIQVSADFFLHVSGRSAYACTLLHILQYFMENSRHNLPGKIHHRKRPVQTAPALFRPILPEDSSCHTALIPAQILLYHGAFCRFVLKNVPSGFDENSSFPACSFL